MPSPPRLRLQVGVGSLLLLLSLLLTTSLVLLMGGVATATTTTATTTTTTISNTATTTTNSPTFTGHADGLACSIPNVAASNVDEVLVADVKNDTFADDNFWLSRCASIPMYAAAIVVKMGNVRDYFRPKPGQSWCEMIRAEQNHEWSADLITWLAFPLPDGLSTTHADFGGEPRGLAETQR